MRSCSKAAAIWRRLDAAGQQRLVAAYLAEAGFVRLSARRSEPRGGDPLYAVIGHCP